MAETRITICLTQDEARALVEIAKAELRHPREQAHIFLRAELERYGLLSEKTRGILATSDSQGEDHSHAN